MMAPTRVGSIDINSKTYDLCANGDGHFIIKDGSTVLGTGETLDKARTLARTAINKRRAKVSVPFRTMVGERGAAHGFHGTTNEVLVRVGDDPDRYDDNQARRVLRADTPDHVIARLIEIVDQESKLAKERQDIVKKWSMSLISEVKAAIAAAGILKALEGV